MCTDFVRFPRGVCHMPFIWQVACSHFWFIPQFLSWCFLSSCLFTFPLLHFQKLKERVNISEPQSSKRLSLKFGKNFQSFLKHYVESPEENSRWLSQVLHSGIFTCLPEFIQCHSSNKRYNQKSAEFIQTVSLFITFISLACMCMHAKSEWIDKRGGEQHLTQRSWKQSWHRLRHKVQQTETWSWQKKAGEQVTVCVW